MTSIYVSYAFIGIWAFMVVRALLSFIKKA
jgi:hypothetical protein